MKWNFYTLQWSLIFTLVIWWLKALFFSPIINQQERNISERAAPILQHSNELFSKNLELLHFGVWEAIYEYGRIDDEAITLAIDTIRQELTNAKTLLNKTFSQKQPFEQSTSVAHDFDSLIISQIPAHPLISDNDVENVKSLFSNHLNVSKSIDNQYIKALYANHLTLHSLTVSNYLAGRISTRCGWFDEFAPVVILESFIPNQKTTKVELLLVNRKSSPSKILHIRHNDKNYPVKDGIADISVTLHHNGNNQIEIEALVEKVSFEPFQIIRDTIVVKDTFNIYAF